jgi:hypothetical protein
VAERSSANATGEMIATQISIKVAVNGIEMPVDVSKSLSIFHLTHCPVL